MDFQPTFRNIENLLKKKVPIVLHMLISIKLCQIFPHIQNYKYFGCAFYYGVLVNKKFSVRIGL